MARISHMTRGSSAPIPWLEIVLPIYALTLVVLYYRPNGVHLPLADERLETIVVWALWIVGGALGGVLVIFGLYLAFCLLYSPFYLAMNLRGALDHRVWIDRSEFRFYLFCFGLLCVLLMLALWNREVALVVFTVLAGSTKLLARLIA